MGDIICIYIIWNAGSEVQQKRNSKLCFNSQTVHSFGMNVNWTDSGTVVLMYSCLCENVNSYAHIKCMEGVGRVCYGMPNPLFSSLGFQVFLKNALQFMYSTLGCLNAES